MTAAAQPRSTNFKKQTPNSTESPFAYAKTGTKDGQSPEIVLPESGTAKLAQELRQRAPALTETYIAYGVCEGLVKECSRVADYTIPQSSEKDGQIPRNDKGEDVGVGQGWWYERTYIYTYTYTLFCLPYFMSIKCSPDSILLPEIQLMALLSLTPQALA